MVCLFVLISASKTTYIYFLVLLSFGICFHFIQKMAKHYHWWEYVEAPPKKKNKSSTPTGTGTTNSPSGATSTTTTGRTERRTNEDEIRLLNNLTAIS